MVSRKQHLSLHQRSLVVDLKNQGKSYRQIQKETGIPFTTVSLIVKKHNLIGTVVSVAGRGRKRKTTSAIDRNIIINVKTNRFISAAKLALKVQIDYNITVTPQTIRNRIREQGYKGRVVRKKPFFTAKQMKRRLELVKKYEEMSISIGNKFCDQLSQNATSSHRMEFRKCGEKKKKLIN